MCFHGYESVKGTVHPKMKTFSSFTHPHLYELLFFLLKTKEDTLKNVGNQTVAGSH